jgi:hypothetical protein
MLFAGGLAVIAAAMVGLKMAARALLRERTPDQPTTSNAGTSDSGAASLGE